MSSSIICRVGIVSALAAGVAWVMMASSSDTAPSRATQYACNDSASGPAQTSLMTPEEAVRRREVERLLSPPVVPGAQADATEAAVMPKVRIRDPFYDYEPALVALAQAEAMKPASKQPVAKPTPAVMYQPITKLVGYGKNTISAAWRKLDTVKRSNLFTQNSDRTPTSRFSTERPTFRSSRFDVFGPLPQ